MKAISTIVAVVVGLGILVYAAGRGISEGVVPPLDDVFDSAITSPFLLSSGSDMASTTADVISDADSGQEGVSDTEADVHLPQNPSEPVDFYVGSASFRVGVAKTPSAREKGLSGRESLGQDEGLLFIFPEPGLHGFWMKEMNFPIDIVWMDRYLKVIGISENVSPESYPELFYPPSPAQFVLEIDAGSARAKGIDVGDRAKI